MEELDGMATAGGNANVKDLVAEVAALRTEVDYLLDASAGSKDEKTGSAKTVYVDISCWAVLRVLIIVSVFTTVVLPLARYLLAKLVWFGFGAY